MPNPNDLLTFLYGILQYGGAVVAGFAALLWIKFTSDGDSDKRDKAQWSALGGIAAVIIGTWLSGFSFPTL